MHIKIIKAFNENELEEKVNELIKTLYSHSRIERGFTEIKDIKYSSTDLYFSAMIILDEDM